MSCVLFCLYFPLLCSVFVLGLVCVRVCLCICRGYFEFVRISAVELDRRERIVSEAINSMLNNILALAIHYDRNVRSFVYN